MAAAIFQFYEPKEETRYRYSFHIRFISFHFGFCLYVSINRETRANTSCWQSSNRCVMGYKPQPNGQQRSPYPNGTETSNPNVLISYCRTYLYENGTSELLEFGDAYNNATNPISTTLNSLLLKANLRFNISLTSGFVSSVLANDKSLQSSIGIQHCNSAGNRDSTVAILCLQDNLNQGLAGTIITLDVDQTYSLWAISK